MFFILYNYLAPFAVFFIITRIFTCHTLLFHVSFSGMIAHPDVTRVSLNVFHFELSVAFNLYLMLTLVIMYFFADWFIQEFAVLYF